MQDGFCGTGRDSKHSERIVTVQDRVSQRDNKINTLKCKIASVKGTIITECIVAVQDGFFIRDNN